MSRIEIAGSRYCSPAAAAWLVRLDHCRLLRKRTSQRFAQLIAFCSLATLPKSSAWEITLGS